MGVDLNIKQLFTKKDHNSIPSIKRILICISEQKNIFVNRKILANKLGIIKKSSIIDLFHKLIVMKKNGLLTHINPWSYGLQKTVHIIKGKVIGHRDGYGFLRTESFAEDIWLSKKNMRSCIHGDTILVILFFNTDKKKRHKVQILQILKKNNNRIVGYYYCHNNSKYVIPYDTRFNFRIFVISKNKINIPKSSIVEIELCRRPTNKEPSASGYIVKVYNKNIDLNLFIQITLKAYNIPYRRSRYSNNELKDINKKFLTTIKNNNRIDIRHIPLVTIDEEDAKDYDDAVFCKKNKDNNWILLVAISDVSYYVKPGKYLDKEAALRGNSVYFTSKVIHMFPEKLSTDICSLNPNLDRFCIVCEIEICQNGIVKSYKHYEAIMRSHARLTYSEVYSIWNLDTQLCIKYKNLVPVVLNLHSIYHILKHSDVLNKRIIFNNNEEKIILNLKNEIISINNYVRNSVHELIELCMILANKCSADFIEKNKIPALFRNHESPTKNNHSKFCLFLKEFNLFLNQKANLKCEDYLRFLNKIKNRSDYNIIEKRLLISMKQAVYSPYNKGHFGLNMSSYVHFTSPIRRYSDVLIHRILKFLLKRNNSNNYSLDSNLINCKYIYSVHRLKKIGLHCSLSERHADYASRDINDWLKYNFLTKKNITETYVGSVTSITQRVIYIYLRDLFIEGCVDISSLKYDKYYCNYLKTKLIGKFKGDVYCLGCLVKVKVSKRQRFNRKIELNIISKYP